MENILKISLNEILYKVIILAIAVFGLVLYAQFTLQSVNNSLTKNIENQNNHAIFSVNY